MVLLADCVPIGKADTGREAERQIHRAIKK